MRKFSSERFFQLKRDVEELEFDDNDWVLQDRLYEAECRLHEYLEDFPEWGDYNPSDECESVFMNSPEGAIYD